MNLSAPVTVDDNGVPMKLDLSFKVSFRYTPFVQKANAPKGTPGGSRSTTCCIYIVTTVPINAQSETVAANDNDALYLTPMVQAVSICKTCDANLYSAAYGRKNALEKALRVLIDREKYTTEHAFILDGFDGCPYKFTDETMKAFVKALRERYPRGWNVAAKLGKSFPTVYNA